VVAKQNVYKPIVDVRQQKDRVRILKSHPDTQMSTAH